MVGLFFVSVVACWLVLCANHDTSTHEKYGVELWRHSGGYVAVSVAWRVSVYYVAGVMFKRGLSDTIQIQNRLTLRYKFVRALILFLSGVGLSRMRRGTFLPPPTPPPKVPPLVPPHGFQNAEGGRFVRSRSRRSPRRRMVVLGGGQWLLWQMVSVRVHVLEQW